MANLFRRPAFVAFFVLAAFTIHLGTAFRAVTHSDRSRRFLLVQPFLVPEHTGHPLTRKMGRLDSALKFWSPDKNCRHCLAVQATRSLKTGRSSDIVEPPGNQEPIRVVRVMRLEALARKSGVCARSCPPAMHPRCSPRYPHVTKMSTTPNLALWSSTILHGLCCWATAASCSSRCCKITSCGTTSASAMRRIMIERCKSQ